MWKGVARRMKFVIINADCPNIVAGNGDSHCTILERSTDGNH